MSDASIRLLVFLCKPAAENYILDKVNRSQHVFTRMTVGMRSDVAAKARKDVLGRDKLSAAAVTDCNYL